MTWLVCGVVGAFALLLGSIGGAIACGLGRIAASSDRADEVAWERWQREERG